MRPPTSCPKCAGPMTQGFAMDHGYGSNFPSSWHPGRIVRSFWTGVKFKRKQLIDIAAWRCDRCGFLECYANGEQA